MTGTIVKRLDLRRIERKFLAEGLNFLEYLRFYASSGVHHFSEMINSLTISLGR